MTDSDSFAARHALLADGYGSGEDPADPSLVQAMPIVLYLPKNEPPRRSAVLEAAAVAVVTLCLDERVDVGGPWHDAYLSWKHRRIRKVARRARGAGWRGAQQVEGVSVAVDGAQARALVPGPIGALDPRIKKLQIGGTELDHDDPGEPAPDHPVLWVNSTLGMTLGKAAAQVGHAAMLLAGAMSTQTAQRWAATGFRCSVRDAGPDRWPQAKALVADGAAVAVRDAGFTEVEPGSITVIAHVPG